MAYSGKEVITLAFGHYSCHVAAHFFNIQEASFSYNPNYNTGIHHDFLFRNGLNVWRKQSYTPRLVALDDVSALRCLSKDGYYKDAEEVQGDVDDQQRDSEKEMQLTKYEEQNEFIKDILREKYRLRKEHYSGGKYLLKSSYALQSSVLSWSDYLVTEFNNRTVVTMPKNTSYFENNEMFSSFDLGLLAWNKTDLKEQIEDNIRRYLEEVDNLQGFQLLFDGNNGYGGVANACLEDLRDEHGKKIIVCFPNMYVKRTESAYNPTVHSGYCEQVFSTACCISSLSEHSDVITPLSHIRNPWGRMPLPRTFARMNLIDNDDMYHTSSILASALDLFTLPPRIDDSGLNMNTFYSNLNSYGRKYLSAGLCMPFPLTSEDSLSSVLDKWEGQFFDSLSPLIELNPRAIDIQCVASKGIKINSSTDEYGQTKRLFANYFSKKIPGAITGVILAKPGFRVPRTFPSDILDNKFNLTETSNNEYGPLAEYCGLGSLHNSREMGNAIKNLYEEVRKLYNIGYAKKLYSSSEMTDYEDIFDNLKKQSSVYEDIEFL